jgi:capsid assembly protease
MDDPNDLITPAGAGPTLIQIASRVLNRPLLLHPTKAEVLLHVLEGRLPMDGSLAPLSPGANRFTGTLRKEGPGRGMYSVSGGTAIVTIEGSLVNRGAWIGTDSGLVSYEGIAAQLRAARDDTEVKSILLDIDSSGGEATGMFATAKLIAEIDKVKPIVAFVNDLAASAAYGLASAAREIVVSPTSVVGSIGVVMTHMDRSAELVTKGIKPTLIYAGSHKVDGNPFGPLTDAVRADLQVEVMKFYDQFTSLVGEGRGAKLTVDMARATEARTFLGQEAVDRGLADRVASLDAVLAGLSPRRAETLTTKKGTTMNGQSETGVPQAQHDAAVAAARTEGATSERARIKGIMTHAEAEGREKLAASLALESDMSVDAAAAILKAQDKASAVAATSGLKTIEQRAEGLAEFGAGTGQKPAAGAEADAGYAKALKKVNATA